MKKVYLDYHSTTPIDKRVLKIMMPFFSDSFGNPASVHSMGEEARDGIESARKYAAALINASPDNIFFTNSATEANNVILCGGNFNSIATTNSEHSSVLECAKYLKTKKEKRLNIIKIEKDGTVDLKKIRKALCDGIDLLSIIYANNEIGTIHDIYEIGNLCKKYNTLLHTDATQAIGKEKIDVDEANIFALTMSGHKIYGPKGVGALYVRDPDVLSPIIFGGLQNTFVSGTQNVPAIVGFGAACDLIKKEHNNEKITKLRDLFLDILMSGIDNISVNGTMKNRLSNNISVTINDVPARILAIEMNDVIISGGSACQSFNPKPSHVIKALRIPNPECAVRISLGKQTTEEDVRFATKRIIETIKFIRGK